MSATSVTLVRDANLETESPCGDSRIKLRWFVAVMQKAHDLWPSKTAANLAVRANVATRTAETWVSLYKAIVAKKPPPATAATMDGTAFFELLQSDEGFEILEAAMKSVPARDRAAWWRLQSNTVRLAKIEQEQAVRDEEIKQLRLELLK